MLHSKVVQTGAEIMSDLRLRVPSPFPSELCHLWPPPTLETPRVYQPHCRCLPLLTSWLPVFLLPSRTYDFRFCWLSGKRLASGRAAVGGVKMAEEKLRMVSAEHLWGIVAASGRGRAGRRGRGEATRPVALPAGVGVWASASLCSAWSVLGLLLRLGRRERFSLEVAVFPTLQFVCLFWGVRGRTAPSLDSFWWSMG